MMPRWPDDLPCQPISGWPESLGENRSLNQGEQGPPRVRRKMSKRTDTVSLTYRFTRNDRARFERFYTEEVEDGSMPFLLPDPGSNNFPLLTAGGLQLMTHDDAPLVIASTWVCLFGTSLPSWVRSGQIWRCSFDWVILP